MGNSRFFLLIRSAAIDKWGALHNLRQNKNEVAINLLESQLDDGLFNIAYMLDNTDFKIDPAAKQTLNKIREYRKKYPREYTNDYYKQKINTLLDR